MLVTPVRPNMVGIQPIDPDTPHIMDGELTPPMPPNENPGIVPPWLQRARDEHAQWLREKDEPDYEPGTTPYDFGYTPDEVANMYRIDAEY